MTGRVADLDLGVEGGGRAGPYAPPAELQRAGLPLHVLVEPVLGLC
jgi:hypothetical protein